MYPGQKRCTAKIISVLTLLVVLPFSFPSLSIWHCQHSACQASASDQDKGQNTRIEYEITDERMRELFKIDKNTGKIHLLKPLDRDQPNGKDMWSFSIVARDNDGSGNTLDGVALVEVYLMDINDNSPVFERVRPKVDFWSVGLESGLDFTIAVS